jgi:hypothetical protein
MSSLLNKKSVRQYLLDAAKTHRPFHKFTRVSDDTLCQAEGALRKWAVEKVKALPSKGATI